MTDLQQPAASPSQTGRGMSLQDVELYLVSLIPIGSCVYWIGQNFVASASVRYLIKQYSQNWESVTDDQAHHLASETGWTWIQHYAVALQVRPDRARGAAGQKGRHFFQLDRRISMMIDLQISSQLPLVQSQE